jgi:hypothetical protein
MLCMWSKKVIATLDIITDETGICSIGTKDGLRATGTKDGIGRIGTKMEFEALEQYLCKWLHRPLMLSLY